MRELESPDAIVVGAGVLGLSITLELAHLGVKALCVGPHHDAPGTASSAAGAMLGALGEVTTEERAGSSAEREIRIRSQRMYPDYLSRIADDSGLSVTGGAGTFVIANLVNDADLDNLAAIRAAARHAHLPAEDVAPADVPGLHPARSHRVAAAVYLPDEGWVETGTLLGALRQAVAQAPSAELRTGWVSGMHRAPGGTLVITLDSGERISSPAVVLAAGFGTQALLRGELRAALPEGLVLLQGKGVSLEARDPSSLPHVIRTPNRDFACGTHVVPRSQGRIYLGATNRISSTPGSTGVTGGEIHALLHSAVHEVDTRLRTAEILSMRHGLRPLSTDHLPIVGATLEPGVFVASGTYRNGVLLAPAVAEIVAQEVVGCAAAHPNPFSVLDLKRPLWRDDPLAVDRHVIPQGVCHGIPHLGLVV